MLRIKKNIAVSETGFVFDPSTGESFLLNQVGIEIFDMIKKEISTEEITSQITQKYDVDVVSFERYFIEFENMLKQMHLTETNV